MPSFQSEPTPNPNSLKITTDAGPFTNGSVASFKSAAEADGHPLAGRLFSIPGIDDVFITPDFLTVTKQASADWNIIMPKVESVLDDHFEDA
jgi:hypothetical protein